MKGQSKAIYIIQSIPGTRDSISNGPISETYALEVMHHTSIALAHPIHSQFHQYQNVYDAIQGSKPQTATLYL